MIRNSRAFSLLEILVAVGVLGAVALTTASISTMMVKASTTAERSQENTALYYELNGIVSNPPLCSDSLRGTVSASGIDLSLTFGASSSIPGQGGGASLQLKAGSMYGLHRIDSLKLEDVSQIGSFYRAVVEIRGKKMSQIYGNQEFISRAPVYYNVDSGSPAKIKECLGTANDNSALCAAIGGVWTERYPSSSSAMPQSRKSGKGSSSNSSTEKFCDQCQYLGGLRMDDGSCLINAGANTGYTWQLGSWDLCSSGMQARTVECIDTSSGDRSPPSSCPIPKPESWKSCSPYDWQIGAWGVCAAGTQNRLVRCIELSTLANVPDTKCFGSKPSSNQTCMGRWVPGSGSMLGYNRDPASCNAPNCPYQVSTPTYKEPDSDDKKPCLITAISCSFAGSCVVGQTEIDSIPMNCIVEATKFTADFRCTCVP